MIYESPIYDNYWDTANDLIRLQVIEYLVKKGYNRTEQMLRQESSNVDKDGRPIVERAEDTGHEKYLLAYRVLSDWIDGTLDVYKVPKSP